VPTTYETAPKAVTDLLADLVALYHPEQAEAGVTYLVLLAHAPRDDEGDPQGAALKHGGYPCAGLVKINSLKERVAGLAAVRNRPARGLLPLGPGAGDQ
jgi:hypothetical protein